MLKLNASAFYEATSILKNTINLTTRPDWPSDRDMTDSNREHSTKTMQSVLEHVKTLGASVTEMAIDELIAELGKQGISYRFFARQADNVDATLRRELKLKTVLVVDSERKKYYDQTEPLFGIDVNAKFPSVSYEITQAGKCYACDLSTSSAFHSLRCLEAGIRAIARCLSIPDPIKATDRNWGAVLRTIKEAIDAKWPGSATRLIGDGHTFDLLHGALAAITNPYRNATMHLETTYDGPDSLHLFEMVKGLMVMISSRMDENGEKKV